MDTDADYEKMGTQKKFQENVSEGNRIYFQTGR